MNLRRILAATAVVVALAVYAQYWISQHPGVKFIGDGNTQTAKYITDSRHYRAWPVVLAELTTGTKVTHAQHVQLSHDLDGIWGIKVSRKLPPIKIDGELLKSLKIHQYWVPSEKNRKGWIAGIYADPTRVSQNAEFTVCEGPGHKFYLVDFSSLQIQPATALSGETNG